jgi:hypothetical protein
MSEAEQIHNFTLKCAADPLFFGKWITPHYFPSKFASFHRHMIREIRDCPKDIEKIVIECPRGTAKTLIVSSLLSIHDCVYNGLKYIVIGSYSDIMAGRIVGDCKNMVKSDRFKKLFPQARIIKDSVYLLEVDNRDDDGGGFHFQIMSRGRGSQVTGLRFEERRIERYVGDDLEDPESVYNQDVVDKNENHIIEVVSPALANNGKIILIGTPFAFDCTTERFSRKERGVRTIKYPILVNTPEMANKLGIAEGHSIWPEDPRFTDEKIWKKRDDMIENREGDVFMRQFMLDPKPPGTIGFDMNKIKYVTPDDIRDIKMNIFILSDFAYSIRPWADDSAIVVVGIDDSNNYYVLYADKGKWGDVNTTKKLIEVATRFKENLRCVGVESHSFKFVQERMLLAKRETDLNFGLTELKTENRPKPERIKWLIPLLEDGRFHMLRGLRLLEGEMMRFRGEKMAHGDDLMDALAYIKDVAYKPITMKTREEKDTEENHRLWQYELNRFAEYKNQPDNLRRVHDSNRDVYY